MSTPDREPKLTHVRRPLKRVEANFAPSAPPDGPVTDGPLIRVGRPLKRVQSSAPAATVCLTLPLATGADGDKMFRTLHALITKVNEMEAISGFAGVWVDGTRSQVRSGEVVIVLSPYDTADALATCKRVAHILFGAAPGATVRVFAAGQPETPVYELAA